MAGRLRHIIGRLGLAVALALLLVASGAPNTSHAQDAAPTYGIAAKRPVLQAACDHCPWGALANVVKKIMAPKGYDVAVCYSCSGPNGARIVSKRLVSAEISDRQFAEGTLTRPDAPIDFGITQAEYVRSAYQGKEGYKQDGPFSNLRVIARIESPNYLMIAAVKSSGITDLKQIAEKKMPVRILAGVGGGVVDTALAYYGITKKDVLSWGGQFLEGNALLKNPNFDLMISVSVLANNPEGNMWYEMSQKKDLVFFPLPDDLRQKLAKDYEGEMVEIPFRYMRGVGDVPVPTVGFSGLDVYGRDDLPDAFVRDVAQTLDENHDAIRWTSQPFSYDPQTVADGTGVPLHKAAEAYYRERGYLK